MTSSGLWLRASNRLHEVVVLAQDDLAITSLRLVVHLLHVLSYYIVFGWLLLKDLRATRLVSIVPHLMCYRLGFPTGLRTTGANFLRISIEAILNVVLLLSRHII